MPSPLYKKLADDTLSVSYDLSNADDWGNPSLSRIFNFTAQQVVTLYERGGLKKYRQPETDYDSQNAFASAVTSSMQVQNFADLPNQAEIAPLHAKLIELGGKPPALETVLHKLDKPRPALGTPHK